MPRAQWLSTFLWLLVLLGGVSPLASAGVITLANGDTLKGQLKGIFATEVVWQSEVLGELRIPKTGVLNISASDEVKLRGKDVPCQVRNIEHEEVAFTCADGDLTWVPLLTLQQVVPFTGVATSSLTANGNLRASGWKQEGNADTAYWEFAGRSSVRHEDLRHVVNLTFARQSTRTLTADGFSDPVTNRRAELVYSLDWFFRPQLYWANQLTARTDDNFNIQEEYNIASGLGYQFWENSATALSMELGLEHSRLYRRFDPPLTEPEIITYARSAMDFRYKLTGGINLYHINSLKYGLNEPDEGDRTRWLLRTQSGLNFPIGFGVSGDIGFEWNYVNHARDLNPTASNFDRVYRFGLNYGW